MLGRLIAIPLLLLLNGFFVAAEFALVRSRRTRLEAMTRAGDRKARIALSATGNLPRMLSASQFGITLTSLGLGYVTESTLGTLLRGYFSPSLPGVVETSFRLTVAGAVALACVTYLHVVFGELAPRGVALNNPERFVRWLAPPLIVFAWLTKPITFILSRSSQLVLRAFRVRVSAVEEPVHSPAELRVLVEQSHERGELQHEDARLIEGVFEFSEKHARDVMTPRTAIVALPADASMDEALTIVDEGGFSRYPVYEETIDQIEGVVLAKDLLRAVRSPAEEFSLRAIMRPAHVVPASREVEDVLADFKRRKEHMAIVLDEYGGTAGIVTMEDLLEEIVGEILDEHDDSIAAAPISSAGIVLVPGDTHVGELNERFGLDLPDDDHTTVGGFVFGTLGRLPVVGDRVVGGGAVFTVREMQGRRISSLAVDLHSAGDRRSAARDAKPAAPGDTPAEERPR